MVRAKTLNQIVEELKNNQREKDLIDPLLEELEERNQANKDLINVIGRLERERSEMIRILSLWMASDAMSKQERDRLIAKTSRSDRFE